MGKIFKDHEALVPFNHDLQQANHVVAPKVLQQLDFSHGRNRESILFTLHSNLLQSNLALSKDMNSLEDFAVGTSADNRLIARLPVVNRIGISKLLGQYRAWLGPSDNLLLLRRLFRRLLRGIPAPVLLPEISTPVILPSITALVEATIISRVSRITEIPLISEISTITISFPVSSAVPVSSVEPRIRVELGQWAIRQPVARAFRFWCTRGWFTDHPLREIGNGLRSKVWSSLRLQSKTEFPTIIPGSRYI
jgi:hypothetical protein